MELPQALSYNDVLLVPQKLDYESRQEIDLSTEIASGLALRLPLISMGMDTVTGVRMAVEMSKSGAISFYPRFDPPEVEAEKTAEIKRAGARVIASIGIRDDYLLRAEVCLKAGAEAVTLDVAHAHSLKALAAVAKFKNKFPKVPMIAGTVATFEGALDLYQKGADCVRVGVGAGTICTTRIVAGSGVPQLSAIFEAAKAKKRFRDKFLIADGGATSSGDIVKALAAGADAVACGSLFAGTDEAPGELVERGGVFYKRYNASTSKSEKANQLQRNNNGQRPHFTLHVEGVESLVRYKGPVRDVISELVAGAKSGFSYSGAMNIRELQRKARFIRISSAGYQESLPHGVVEAV